jgi:hypothetical protein
MAAGSFVVYSNAALEMGNGVFDLNADTYIMALLTNSYTPAPNTDATWADVSADEVASGSGYTAGGVVLSGFASTLSTATVTVTCTAPTWATFSATFRYAVIVRRAGGSVASTDKLLCYVDCTGSGSITGGGGTLTITPNASGLFTITHSP